MIIRSPSLTKAIGPPTRASGTTCPMMNPRLAPENRPSVIKAVDPASPAPAIAPVGPEAETSVTIYVDIQRCTVPSISGMPGAPLGP